MRGNLGTNGILVAAAAIVVCGLLAIAYLGGGAGGLSGTRETADPAAGPSGSEVRFLGRSDALDGGTFEGTEIGGLSALAYDSRRDLYYALMDRREGSPARYYALRVSLDGARLGEPEVFDVVVLRDEEGEPFGAGGFDGEGVAVSRWGELLVASESGPRIFRFALDGRLLGELPVPEKFLVFPRGGAEPYYSFEALALAPDGGAMFVAPRRSLLPDTTEGGANRRQIRLLRYELGGAGEPRPSGEFFYAARSGGGIVDMAAVSGSELLVLEHDNQLFRADLSGARDVSDFGSLSGVPFGPVRKEFVADLDDCAPAVETPDGEPPAYEGMAIGPELSGGGRALLLLSDDNFDEDQTTSITAISLPSSPGGKLACP